MYFRTALLSLLVITSLLTGCGSQTATTQNPFGKINHLIVLYQENWSFDSLYGYFPGADGIKNASSTALQQVNKDGKPYTTLPQPLNNKKPDDRFPANLPVQPFDAVKICITRSDDW